MKSSTLAKSIVGLSVLFSVSAADAAVTMTPTSTGFQFSNSVGTSFNDYLSFNTAGTNDIFATVSGNAKTSFNFSTFDLLASDKSTILATGSISNLGATLSFAGFNSTQGNGSYWLEIAGTSSGVSSGYAGVVTLTPVPEPESTALMIAGLGLIGLIARRRFV